MHKIHLPLAELTTLPRTPSRMVRGHLSPHLLPLVSTPSASRSQDTEWGGGDRAPAIMFSEAPLWLSTGLM